MHVLRQDVSWAQPGGLKLKSIFLEDNDSPHTPKLAKKKKNVFKDTYLMDTPLLVFSDVNTKENLWPIIKRGEYGNI